MRGLEHRLGASSAGSYQAWRAHDNVLELGGAYLLTCCCDLATDTRLGGRACAPQPPAPARWEPLCRAHDAHAAGYALSYQPRRALALRQLAGGALPALAGVARGEFDYTGLLLWAAPPQEAGGRGAPCGATGERGLRSH